MASKIIKYVENSSVIHKLDPRSKLILLFSVLASSTLAYNLVAALPILVFSFIIYFLAKLPWSATKNTWKFIVSIIVFLSTLNYLFVAVLFRHGGRPLSLETLLDSEILARTFTPIVKLLSLAVATVTFVYTTPPYLYAPALGQIGLNYKAAYVVQLGLRYFPEFIEEMKRTLEAQMARGYKPRGGGNIIARIAALAPLIVPVTVSASLSIYDIADAMELRGFGENKCHTWFRKLKFSRNDFLVFALSGVMITVYTILFIVKPI